MMRRLFGRKGQSITEYAIMVGLVVGALIAMQTYVKNSLSAKIKIAADGIHETPGEYIYQPKTTTSSRVVLRNDGIKSHTIDESGIKIDRTGARTSVIEDIRETKFHELELEHAGK